MTLTFRMQLTITNADYHGREDPVFWIETKTDLNKYKKKHKRTPRYYSELEKLHDYLEYTLDDVLIPALPPCPVPRFDREGKVVGRQWWMMIRLPSEDSTTTKIDETDLVEHSIQLWLDRISEHQQVVTCEGLRDFVESETGFRISSKPYKSTQMLIHASENDMEPEFAYWIKEFTNFSHNLSHILTRIDTLVKEGDDVAKAWIDLSSAWVSYGGLERNPNLFILYKSIAKACRQLFYLERSQVIAVTETLGTEIRYQIRNCSSTQNAMQRRLDAVSDYMSSRKETESKLRDVERLKSSINIDRNQASSAITKLENARINEKTMLNRYKRLDLNLRQNIETQYMPNVTKDMLGAVKEYAKSQLFLEKKKLQVFQKLLGKLH